MTSLLPEPGWRRTLVLLAYGLALILGWMVFYRYLFLPLLPFLLAFLSASLLRPLILAVHRRTRLPVGAVGSFFALLFISAALCLVILLMTRLVQDAGDFLRSAVASAEGIIADIFDLWDNLEQRIPLLGRLQEGGISSDAIRQGMTGVIVSGLEGLSAQLPGKAMAMAAYLPRILLFLLVLVIATVYLCADMQGFCAFGRRLLPEGTLRWLRGVRHGAAETLGRYCRAYFLILLITFCELSLGLTLLKVENSLFPAAWIALVDILPVLGAGTVLIPWALICFVEANAGLGWGLLALYLIMTVLRQIIEPKIVSGSFGLPPVVTLMGLYVGYRLMGFLGLLLSPVLLVILTRTGEEKP